MEHENLDFKVVMADGPKTEILARAASLDIAAAAYMAAVAKHPLHNIGLRQGAQVIKRHDGEPKPEPPPDPNLKSWSAYMISGLSCCSTSMMNAASRCR